MIDAARGALVHPWSVFLQQGRHGFPRRQRGVGSSCVRAATGASQMTYSVLLGKEWPLLDFASALRAASYTIFDSLIAASALSVAVGAVINDPPTPDARHAALETLLWTQRTPPNASERKAAAVPVRNARQDIRALTKDGRTHAHARPQGRRRRRHLLPRPRRRARSAGTRTSARSRHCPSPASSRTVVWVLYGVIGRDWVPMVASNAVGVASGAYCSGCLSGCEAARQDVRDAAAVTRRWLRGVRGTAS